LARALRQWQGRQLRSAHQRLTLKTLVQCLFKLFISNFSANLWISGPSKNYATEVVSGRVPIKLITAASSIAGRNFIKATPMPNATQGNAHLVNLQMFSPNKVRISTYVDALFRSTWDFQ
jgi:hypothetical protein